MNNRINTYLKDKKLTSQANVPKSATSSAPRAAPSTRPLPNGTKSQVPTAAPAAPSAPAARKSVPPKAAPRQNRRHVNSSNLESLPLEVLLNIFGMVSARDLIALSSASKRLNQLASDNVLWAKYYNRHAARSQKEMYRFVPDELPPKHLKKECLSKCKKRRDDNFSKTLKGVDYTGLPAKLKTRLEQLNLEWELTFQLKDMNALQTFQFRDSCLFKTSLCVRFFDAQFPPIHTVKAIQMKVLVPVFFDMKGNPAKDSPMLRSLLLEIPAESVRTLKPDSVKKGAVSVFQVHPELAVGIFKEGGEPAFFTAMLHFHYLLERCLFGSSNSKLVPPIHKPKPCDIDSQYGLHGYNFFFEIHGQRPPAFMEHQVTDICTDRDNLGKEFVELVVVKEKDKFMCPMKGMPVLRWKTEAFHGEVKDYFILDVTLADSNGDIVWAQSFLVKCHPKEEPSCSEMEYSQKFLFQVDAENRRLKGTITQEDGNGDGYFLSSLELGLTPQLLNAWFSTKY